MSTSAAPNVDDRPPLPAKTPLDSSNVDKLNHSNGDGSSARSKHARNLSTASITSASSLRNGLPQLDTATKLARNVSPGLLARMKFLNQQTTDANNKSVDVGRIEDDKIRKLDEFHKDRSWNVDRRGAAWSGLHGQPESPSDPTSPPSTTSPPQPQQPPPPTTTTTTTAATTMEPDFESDHSSVISTSDKVLPSESDADDAMDMQKYRLPDITKTKSLNTSIAQTEANTTDTEPSRAPTPPPKDTPPIPPPEEVSVLDDNNGIDIASYFEKRHFPRANSIYTLSKASFTNQIQQLTSMKLPPTTIASEITALPSSTLAGRALHKAANDIRLWIAKTKEVLNGLDAEDDVEWAAAAGREGLEEVDAAISKFEGLVTVYITAIEDLQSRPDIAALPSKDQATLVSQMEDIVSNWSQVKQTLKGIKNQVEIAMEWEELWNNVLGEIGFEVENLSRLVFEMEERRHRVISDSVAEAPEKFDIAELETIVEETPRKAKMMNNRFSMPLPPTLSVLSPVSPIPQIEQENSRLLALFAKLQPLRASLDFLPMRLTAFQMRASTIFPSACDELIRRKEQLEEQEKKLEAEADALREELGEDKWVHSFRQAGSKAVAMYESCMKSIQRLTQAIEDNDEEKLPARIATYKDKKSHYPPSMRRVLELIDIEMKHRSTVNGEILRIQQDVRTKVTDLETVTKDMDAVLADFTASRKLRDSVSTVLSSRTEASSARETPNSSPASSVVMSRKSSDYSSLRPSSQKSRQSSFATPRSSLAPDNRRYSSINLGPSGPSYSVPKAPLNRLDLTPSRAGTSTPTRNSRLPQTERPAVKPRWSSDVKVRESPTGPSFKPLGSTTPSLHRVGTPDRLLRTGYDDKSGDAAEEAESPVARRTTRPASVMDRRRSSLLPTMKQRSPSAAAVAKNKTTPERSAGTASRVGMSGASGRMSSAGERPKWK
ncbi:KAR9-domain-containing protein [Plenodomus tracheiphilus IPT5]|uniref:KAR9-domain-containing protein n=1 Tax=Plenodomus tracheiphilus IPT5 TaxID=1408161 RepID=A0A6A7B1S7_9PLEO|nr:KAR9-domain-containing protein [Plenodomus tracheiphilus IPT5]